MKSYDVWDAPTRWFHWINVVAVIVLIISGLVILYAKELSISEGQAKLAFKAVHSLVGYVLVFSLLGRFVWGFLGNRLARWSSVLPNRESLKSILSDIRQLVERRPMDHLGRGPAGRVSATILFALLLLSAVTGLIRAGTDLYYPPFGEFVASYVKQPGVETDELLPFVESNYRLDRLQTVKKYKFKIGAIHLYLSYAIILMVVLHVTFVALREIRQGGAIISAMFSGRKILSQAPVDGETSENTAE